MFFTRVGEARLEKGQIPPTKLRESIRPRHEVDMKVCAAISPAIEVHASHSAEVHDGVLNPCGNGPEFSLPLRRHLAQGVDVCLAEQEHASGEG